MMTVLSDQEHDKNRTRDWQHHTYIAFRKPLEELRTDKYGQKNYKGTKTSKKEKQTFQGGTKNMSIDSRRCPSSKSQPNKNGQ